MKKNIAFIIGHLTHGGAEKQLYLLSKWIDKNQFNPIVICLSNASHPWGPRIQKLGLNIIYIPRLSSFDITRVIKLAWYLYNYKIDLIVSYLHIANVYSWLARKIYFRQSVYIAQVRSKESGMSLLLKSLNILAFNSAKIIITNTSLLRPFVIDFFNQPKEKIITINNGIEIDGNKKKKINEIIRICTVGKDTDAKNIDLFIKIALNLVTDFQNIHFNLCGRGLGKNSRVYDMVPKKYKSFFTFHDEIDQIDVFYKNNDIYLSTSLSEGSPNAIMEAMSYGLPIVATDVGGVSELVKHKVTGFLVLPTNIEKLLNACQILVKNSDMRLKMSSRAKKLIKNNYSSEEMAKKFENIFNKVLLYKT